MPAAVGCFVVFFTDQPNPFTMTRTTFLLITCATTAFASGQPVFNADPEPNDHFQDAVPLTLGVAFEGQLNVLPGDIGDIYSFVLPDDGVLLLDVQCEQSGIMTDQIAIRGFALMDSTSIMVPMAVAAIGNSGVPAQSNTEISCMKAGTHYLRVAFDLGSTNTNAISYSVTATHRPMAFANDVEPNNTMATAIPLAADTWTEGRLSVEWPNTDPADDFDYYVITKSYTGPLVLFTEVAAEYANTPDELFEFNVHNADMTVVSEGDGRVSSGSEGVPVADTAIYTTIVDSGIWYVRVYNPPYYGLCYRFSYSSTEFLGIAGKSEALVGVVPNPSDRSFRFTGADIRSVVINDAQGRFVDRLSTDPSPVWDATANEPGIYIAHVFFSNGTGSSLRLVLTS